MNNLESAIYLCLGSVGVAGGVALIGTIIRSKISFDRGEAERQTRMRLLEERMKLVPTFGPEVLVGGFKLVEVEVVSSSTRSPESKN